MFIKDTNIASVGFFILDYENQHLNSFDVFHTTMNEDVRLFAVRNN